MNITVIGASAGVGIETVKRALDRGHLVTALSRSEINLPDHKNLKKVKGDATNKDNLMEVIRNADAVIVGLGTGTSIKATTLFSDTAKLLVEVDKEFKKDIPFIVLTGFGAGESRQYLSSFIQKFFFKFFLDKEVYKDKNKMEEIISNSKMKWEIVRAGTLADKPLTEKYRAETSLYKGINIGNINRADVADFMVKQAENPTQQKKYISLSNK